MISLSSLNQKDLASMTNRLKAPMVVQDVMAGNAVLDDVTRYALHEIISEYQPDTALLCVALSVQKIASNFQSASPIMKLVYTECVRLTEEYGSVWLDFVRTQELGGDLPAPVMEQEPLFELLSSLPEDLRSLSDLMDLARGFLAGKHADAASLCDIFKVQAQAHSLIAEELLRLYEEAKEKDILSPLVPTTENIVYFPPMQV